MSEQVADKLCAVGEFHLYCLVANVFVGGASAEFHKLLIGSHDWQSDRFLGALGPDLIQFG